MLAGINFLSDLNLHIYKAFSKCSEWVLGGLASFMIDLKYQTTKISI